MKRTTLDLLACPDCHGDLSCVITNTMVIQSGDLSCPRCGRDFSIMDGIPIFIKPDEITGFNRRFSRMYDLFSWGYRAFSKIAFVFIGMDEETGRREITDRLDPQGGSVLEVSIGPGVNLPYLVNREDIGEIFGLDISPGQLKQCKRYCARKNWEVELFHGNGEKLPFKDNTFGGVLHVGGINFFNNKKAAIDEMIRVARPGARILIADETEKGARGYEVFIPGFKKSFDGRRDEVRAPIDLIPSDMLETRLFDAWKGWFYCIEFRKPWEAS